MNKYLAIFSGTLTSIVFPFIIAFVFDSIYSDIHFVISLLPGIIILIVTSFFLYKKNLKILSYSISIPFLVILSGAYLYKGFHFYEKIKNKPKYEWLTEEDKFTVDFIAEESGHILIKAKINNEKGLFLFDTGASRSLAHENTLDSLNSTRFHELTDASNIKQRKKLIRSQFRLDSLEINELEIFPLDSMSWLTKNGSFFNKNHINGVVGYDIINQYVWDFNMVDKKLTISNSSKYCNNIPDSVCINLIKDKNKWYIPVLLNNLDRKLLLDFGCSGTLNIRDTISPTDRYVIQGINLSYSSLKRTGFSHLRELNRDTVSLSAVNLQFGNYLFNRIRCIEGSKKELFGIKFIWSFERVILDGINNKIYFLNERDDNSPQSAKQFSKLIRKTIKSKFSKNNEVEVSLYNGGVDLNSYFLNVKDTVHIKTAHGRIKLLNRNNHMHVLFKDSITLNDSKTKYGPIELKYINGSNITDIFF